MGVMRKLYNEEGVFEAYKGTGLMECERVMFSKHLKGAVLDIGSHIGRVSFPVAESGFRTVGIDLAEKSLLEAKKRRGKKSNPAFAVSDSSKLPFKDNSFGTVLMVYNFIGCLPSGELRKETFSECFRALNKGGKLLFSFHNRLCPKFLFGLAAFDAVDLALHGKRKEFGSALVADEGGKTKVPHHFFMPGDVENLINGSGFSIIEKHPVERQGPGRRGRIKKSMVPREYFCVCVKG